MKTIRRRKSQLEEDGIKGSHDSHTARPAPAPTKSGAKRRTGRGRLTPFSTSGTLIEAFLLKKFHFRPLDGLGGGGAAAASSAAFSSAAKVAMMSPDSFVLFLSAKLVLDVFVEGADEFEGEVSIEGVCEIVFERQASFINFSSKLLQRGMI